MAASATWNGTIDATWANAANWSVAPVPGAAAGETATFSTVGNANTTIDLGAGVTVKSIAFSTGTAPYTIGAGAVGSQILTLENTGGITMNNGAATNQLFNAGLNLGTGGTTQSVTVTNNQGGNTITLAGGVSTNQTGSKVLAVGGSSGTVVSGVVSNGTGTVSISKSAGGLLTLSGNNSYSGGTSITGGLVLAANNNALGTALTSVGSATTTNGGAQLQLANGVQVSTPLLIGNTGVNGQGQLYVPNGYASTSGAITIAGNPTAGGTFAAANGILTILGDNTLTVNALTQVGTPVAIKPVVRMGLVRYAGAQSYTSGTTINLGTLQFTKLTSMPATGTVALQQAGSGLAVNVGGPGEFNTSAAVATGSVGGILAGMGGQGAPITWVTNCTFGIDTSNSPTTQTYSGPLASAVAANTLGFIKLGTGTLELTGGGTYNGNGHAGVPLMVREGTLLLNGGTHTVTGEVGIGDTFARSAGNGNLNGDAGTNARLQIDSGVLTVSANLSTGRGNGVGGVTSELVLNNSAVVNTAGFSAGWNKFGWNFPKGTITLNNNSTLNHTGGGEIMLGQSVGSNMSMTLNNASRFLVAAGNGLRRLGAEGTGILNINDTAQFTLGTGTSPVYLGYRTGTGTVNLAGGTFTAPGEVWVGGTDNAAIENATGTINVTGGTANIGSLLAAKGLNSFSVTTGTVNVSGGILNCANNVSLGYEGNNNLGKMVISGTGVFNTGSNAGNSLDVGAFSTSRGQLDISGGALNVRSNSFLRMNSGTTVGANVINQTGGAITFFSDAGINPGGTGILDLQYSGDVLSNNTYNLDGGTLTVPQIISTATSGTRTFNFNGGTLKSATTGVTLLDLGLGDGVARANVRNGGAVVDTNAHDVTIAQALVHSDIPADAATDGGLTKLGAGTLSLTGASTYTGPTAANAGTLDVSGTMISNITVANQAAITGSGSTTGSLTFDAGSNFSAKVGAITPLAANGVTFAGPTNLNFNGTPVSGQQFTMLKYGPGALTGLPSLTSAFRTSIVNDTTNKELKVTVTTFGLNWNGDVLTGTWAPSATGWAGGATSYFDGDSVTFGQRAASVVNIPGSVSPQSIVVNSTNAYTFTGAGSINGATSLLKNGTGALTIATANSYTGGTTLSSGTLNINSATALGTGPLTISGGVIDNTSGAPVVMTNNITQTWNGNFAFTGTNNLDLGRGAVTLDGDRTVTVNAGTLAVGELSAPAVGQTFTKDGAGKLEVGSSGNNIDATVINGVLNVAAGELQINRTGQAPATSGDLTAYGITGSGTITNGAAGTRWLYSIPTEGAFNFGGTLANGGAFGLGFYKGGLGTQILSGTNSYTDVTTVAGGGELIITGPNTGPGTNVELQNGKLTLGNAQALGTNSFINMSGTNLATLELAIDTDVVGAPYTFKASSGNAGTIIANRATPGAGINHTLSTLITNGVGGATLNFISGANVTSGHGRITFPQFYFNAGSVQTTHLVPTSASVTLGDVNKQSNNFSLTLDLAGTSADNFVTGVISNGPALLGANNISVLKTGSSTWTLSGNSTYTGTTAVNEGTLVITGNNSAASGAVTVASGATLGGNGNLGGTVSIGTGGTHALNVASTPGAQITRIITGSLNHDIATVLNLTASSQPADGSYPLVTVTGAITGFDPLSVTYSGITGGSVAVVDKTLVLTIGGAAPGFAGWASANAPGQTMEQDHDNDDVDNGIEYFMGLSGSGFTANPPLSGGTVTWTKGAGYTGTYGTDFVIQSSADLFIWTDVPVGSGPLGTVANNAGSVSYTPPTGQSKRFGRLKVTN